jgi:hypothetical protein
LPRCSNATTIIKAEAMSTYRGFRSKLSDFSISEFILVALSFAMAVIAFIFYSLYEIVWWWL